MNKVSPEFLSQLNYLRMVPSPSIALLFLGTRIMLPSEESVLCPFSEITRTGDFSLNLRAGRANAYR